MSHLPLPMIGFFLLTTALALFAFNQAVRSTVAVGVALAWMCVQSAIALSGFYFETKTMPPRLALAILPPLLVMVGMFATVVGRRFIDGMDLKWSVLLHTIRILVEINLYLLFVYRQVPKLMTFEAGNVDILIGVTAPLAWWAYRTGRIGRVGLLVWNGLGLLSVLNAFGRAMLSAPFRFERLAFDQPTVAILSFPFVLLPAFIAPVAIFCHLVLFWKMRGRVEAV